MEYVRCVCEMCMCLAQGGVGGEGDEWMRGLDFGFTIPVGARGVWDVCLHSGCSGVSGGEWVRGLDQGLEGWGGVMYVGAVCDRYDSSSACRRCRLVSS